MSLLEPVAQATINSLVTEVDKPARYTGGEVNAVVKPGPVRARLALCFPDVYEVAESHLGFKILYEIVNDRPEYAAERVYAFWPDLERRARAAHVPLWSLETLRPLAAFDVVGFTLQYELSYPTILAMLDHGGVPVRAGARADSDPIVIGGGIGAFNPEPIAPFFDAFLLGDGEQAILDILAVVAAGREAHKARADILVDLARLEGVYVPAHFEVEYAGLAVTKLVARPSTPHVKLDASTSSVPRVARASVAELDLARFSTRPIVPNVQPVHERVAIEIQRGCSRACRFCQPGFVTRPTRQRRPETIERLAAEGLASSGCDAVGLLSLSAGDYAPLSEVVSHILTRHQKDRVAVSLPSLRSETMTPELAERLAASSSSGFTFAPEAGSERLRRVINKSSSDQDLLNAVKATVERGWRNLKFYFMIGLPTETEADLQAILDVAIRARTAARTVRQDANVTVAVSTFVPKPHTPFEWESQISIDQTRAKQRFLREALRQHRMTLRYHSPEQSFIEGVLSRGDRRLADAIEKIALAGARLDAWTELFDHSRWMKALRETLAPHGLTPEDYLGSRAHEALLPWDHLDAGPSKKFLHKDREQAMAEKPVGDCAFGADCYACGACALGTPHADRSAPESTQLVPRVYAASLTPAPFTPSPDVTQRTPSTAPAKSRLRFRFNKVGRAVHLSQLDTLNQVVRAIRQSGMPVMYTEGHVPRPRVGFSPACPTGIESLAEYFEVDCAGFPDPESYATKLNTLLPDGVRVVDSAEIPFDTPSFNELIRSTTYSITTPADFDVGAAVAAFLARPTCWVRITRKAKPRVVDAKSCIAEAKGHGNELLLTLGFSRFGTIKIGEAAAVILGRDTLLRSRIRKEAAEIGREPLSHEAPVKVAPQGPVLDLTDLSERRTPESSREGGKRMSHTASPEALDRRAPKRGRAKPQVPAPRSTLPRPLSIAMVAPCPFPSHQGTQVMLRHLAQALTDIGHEVHFITYGYGEYEDHFDFHLHRAFKLDLGLRSGPSFLKPAADAALLLTAARVAETERCDLWHVHNVEGLALGALLKAKTRLPLVYHAHNAMGPELPTYFHGRSAQVVAGIIGDVFDRTLPGVADAVIAFDEDHKAMHALYGVRPSRIHVVPPGVDGSEVTGPNKARLESLRQRLGPGPWLFYAGNPDAYQNLGLLWQAVAAVRGVRPEVRLLVASTAPEEAFAAERNAADALEGVAFERYENLDELKALFAMADIGLSPRALWAGAPIKILNYLAAGLPVVACRSGARHLLTPACGLLVDNTPQAFADGILQLLDKPVGSALLRRRVFDGYRMSAQMPLYEAVYRQVLAPPAASP